MEMAPTEFGPLLHYDRERYFTHTGATGMSLTELAHRTELDIGYLKRLETGERQNPSWRTVILIARALELSERQSNELLHAAGFSPLPPLYDYDGRFRRRGWG